MVVFNTFVSFLQSFLVCVLCLIYDTNTSRINILKRFSSFSVPQWNIKTRRLYPLTGYKKHLQTRKRIWLVTSDLKRELGGCTSRVQAFPEWGNGYFSGPKRTRNDNNSQNLRVILKRELCGQTRRNRKLWQIWKWQSWIFYSFFICGTVRSNVKVGLLEFFFVIML